MKSYYRIMLGKWWIHADECLTNWYIWCHFDIDQDLSNELPDDWRKFNAKFRPIRLEKHPEKSKIAAWLSCGFLWTISKWLKRWDIVLCPDGTWRYHVWEVEWWYYYVPDTQLPHRRNVNRLNMQIDRSDMSESLKNSSGSIGTVSEITQYAPELEWFISGQQAPGIIATNDTIENPTEFALEKHLEEFLVKNWSQTELWKKYDIFSDEETIGQQYPTDTWYIDILAVSKDKKELLVVELKKWRVSDVVVWQIQRYMWYVIDELAESWQEVKWIIIGLDDDIRIQRALRVTNNIEFYRYKVNFELRKG